MKPEEFKIAIFQDDDTGQWWWRVSGGGDAVNYTSKPEYRTIPAVRKGAEDWCRRLRAQQRQQRDLANRATATPALEYEF